MSKLKLSVIMPGYNPDEHEVRECIYSILASIDQRSEVLYVDDKSPYQPQCIDEICKKDSRLRVIHLPENKGQAYARNIGIERAAGEFVTFADQDDIVVDGWYERGLDVFEQNAVDVVVAGVKTIWKKEKLQKIDLAENRVYGELKPNDLLFLCRKCLFNYPWNKIYRKSFLMSNNVRFEEMSVPREDEVFNLRCVNAHARFATVDMIGYVYNHYGLSTLGRYRKYDDESRRFVCDEWQACGKVLNDVDGVLVELCERSESEVFKRRWQNIWRACSPYSYVDRWKWLNENLEKCILAKLYCFFWMVAYQLCRRALYGQVVKRWHIRRLYKHVTPLSE